MPAPPPTVPAEREAAAEVSTRSAKRRRKLARGARSGGGS